MIPRGTAIEHSEVPDCNRSTNIVESLTNILNQSMIIPTDSFFYQVKPIENARSPQPSISPRAFQSRMSPRASQSNTQSYTSPRVSCRRGSDNLQNPK